MSYYCRLCSKEVDNDHRHKCIGDDFERPYLNTFTRNDPQPFVRDFIINEMNKKLNKKLNEVSLNSRYCSHCGNNTDSKYICMNCGEDLNKNIDKLIEKCNQNYEFVFVITILIILLIVTVILVSKYPILY